MAAATKRLKRWLYLGHRWLGILTCLLFAVWFVSGVVMMYVGFPRLTDDERRQALPDIAWDRVSLSPGEALTRAGLSEADARRLSLSMLDAEPVYRIVPWQGAPRAISARDGVEIAPATAETAQAVARHHPAAGDVTDLGLVERDQWSVPQRFDPLRPFHLIALGDTAGTELYVSRPTGEIALDTTRSERFWNWLGAVPHWIYFTPLRAKLDLWRDVVLWLSGVGIAGALTGLVVGVIRVRLRRRYRGGAVTPYRGWMSWHHLGGLVAGTAVVTFIVSGWISMNPNRWFSPRDADRGAIEGYAGTQEAPPPFDPAPLSLACRDAGGADRGVREARFTRVGGKAFAVLSCADERVRVCCGADAPTPEIIEAAARHLMPEQPAPRVETLGEEDAYWYAHHRERVLPALRVVFDDPAATWFHIDPATGEVLGRMDRSNRLYRWLFNAPHSLDFAILTRHRPAWDAVVLMLSLGGLLISVSGIVIGWRRLARPR